MAPLFSFGLSLSYRDAVFLSHAGLDLGVDPQLVLTLPLRVEQHRLELHPHLVGHGLRTVRLLRHDRHELFHAAPETRSRRMSQELSAFTDRTLEFFAHTAQGAGE